MDKAKWPLPPEVLQGVVGRPRGDAYVAGGRKHFEEMRALGELTPSDSVLDVGCGPGRVAMHLAGFLNEQGAYAGLDVHGGCTDWFQGTLKDLDLPNFQCYHMDVASRCYNSGGAGDAATARFPCNGDRFSFIIGLSLFTHMLTPCVIHYLSEMRKCATVGGTLYLSMFVLDDEARKAVQENKVAEKLRFDQEVLPNCWSCYGVAPEEAVAYDRDYFLNMLGIYGWEICDVYTGKWAPRVHLTPRDDGQDLIVAQAV